MRLINQGMMHGMMLMVGFFYGYRMLSFKICGIDSLFNHKALQEYILYAGQHPSGGLRDKPPKYTKLVNPFTLLWKFSTLTGQKMHTIHCIVYQVYCQCNIMSFHPLHDILRYRMHGNQLRVYTEWILLLPSGWMMPSTDISLDLLRKSTFSETLSWIEEESASKILGRPNNQVLSSLLCYVP